MIQSLVIYSGINTDEEGVVHDDICVRQVPRNAVGDVLIGRMAQKIAAEKVSGLDAVGLQECGQVVAGKTGIEHPPGVVDQVFVGIEGFIGKLRLVVIFDEGEDLAANGFGGCQFC